MISPMQPQSMSPVQPPVQAQLPLPMQPTFPAPLVPQPAPQAPAGAAAAPQPGLASPKPPPRSRSAHTLPPESAPPPPPTTQVSPLSLLTFCMDVKIISPIFNCDKDQHSFKDAKTHKIQKLQKRVHILNPSRAQVQDKKDSL